MEQPWTAGLLEGVRDRSRGRAGGGASGDSTARSHTKRTFYVQPHDVRQAPGTLLPAQYHALRRVNTSLDGSWPVMKKTYHPTHTHTIYTPGIYYEHSYTRLYKQVYLEPGIQTSTKLRFFFCATQNSFLMAAGLSRALD